MKKYISLCATAVISCIFMLFFAAYGVNHKLNTVVSGMWQLIRHTVLGSDLQYYYFGVNGVEFWYSIRLIVISLLISLLLGALLAIMRVRARSIAKTIIEVPFTLVEAIPEPLYVVLMVLLVLFLLEHTSIRIPAFPFEAPSWIDTIIPAIALGLPGAFYLSRILQISTEDELNAQYVMTARSKGLTKSQAFYRHVLSNVVPVFISQFGVVCAITLASSLFAEYMLGYQGVLFHFVEYGFLGTQRPRGIPSYEPGLILLVGSFLVAVWLICTLGSRLWYDTRYPNDIETTPSPQVKEYQFSWIVAGAMLILVVILCSMFPHVVTPNSPTQRHLFDWKTDNSPPYGPSAKFPMGTDYVGRDMLARALNGTTSTLLMAVSTTVLVVVFSLGISALAAMNANGWSSKVAKFIGNMLTGLPVLIILMTALHIRNIHSPYQELAYIAWLVVFETGRGVYSFLQTYEQWYQYGFVEGALSIGRSRIAVLFVHFRKWLQRYVLEFAFQELSRVISLMTMLAVFQIYAVETMGYPSFYYSSTPTLVSAQNTWFSIIGDATNGGAFMNQLWFLYAAVICLLLVTVGSNLIARGLRGKNRG